MATSIITDAAQIEAFNRGPLVTPTSVPSSCVATLTLAGTAWYFGHLTNPYYDPPCLPPGRLSRQELLNVSNWGNYFYSPAVSCPIGWSTARTFTGISPAFDYYQTTLISLRPETSAALCCPSGYEYWTWGHGCSSILTRNQVVQYVAPTFDGNSGWTRGPISTKTFLAETAVVGDGVPIWWQSSDVAAAATGAAVIPTPAITSMTGSIPSSTSPSSSTISPLPNKAGGITTGVGVGIGVGVFAALLIGVGLGILLRRRSNRRTEEKRRDTEHRGLAHQDLVVEMYAPHQVHEIHTQPEEYFERHELAEKE